MWCIRTVEYYSAGTRMEVLIHAGARKAPCSVKEASPKRPRVLGFRIHMKRPEQGAGRTVGRKGGLKHTGRLSRLKRKL